MFWQASVCKSDFWMSDIGRLELRIFDFYIFYCLFAWCHADFVIPPAFLFVERQCGNMPSKLSLLLTKSEIGRMPWVFWICLKRPFVFSCFYTMCFVTSEWTVSTLYDRFYFNVSSNSINWSKNPELGWATLLFSLTSACALPSGILY